VALGALAFPPHSCSPLRSAQGDYLAAALAAAAEAAARAHLEPAAAARAIAADAAARAPFAYAHRGSLAALGRFAGAADFTAGAPAPPLAGATLSGFGAFAIWRSAYLTKLGSWRNRVQVPLDWLRTLVFGRDTTLF
jgi:NADH dehydrogenase FAD-containing subunit